MQSKDRNYVTLPKECKEQANAIRDKDVELHEHHATARGLAELQLAQNHDVHVLALPNSLVIEENIFPLDIKEFDRMYHHQNKDLF